MANPGADSMDLFDGMTPEAWSRANSASDLFDGMSPDEWTRSPKLVQGEEKGFFGRLVDRLARDPEAERAKSANVMAIAKSSDISPVAAEDQYEDVKDTVRDQPDIRRTLGQAVKKSVRASVDPRTYVGLNEGAKSVVSGMAALPVAGLAGVRAAVSGGDGKRAVEQTAEALTYAPKTPEGRTVVEVANAPFELLKTGAGAAGDAVYDATGSPVLAAGTATVIEALPVLFPLAKGMTTRTVELIKKSTPYRMATIKERGLVVQGLEETLAKNPGLSEAELVKTSNAYFDEAMAKRRTGSVSDRTNMVRDEAGTGGSMTENVIVPESGAVDLLDGVAPEGFSPAMIKETPLPAVDEVGGVDLFEGVAPVDYVAGPETPNTVPGSDVVEPATNKIRKASTAGQNIRTLRGAIKAKGGINFQNFTGELRDMTVDVKYLAKRGGRPLDTLESELKSEGWLAPGESLLESLRDNPAILRRGPLSQDLGDKPAREYTPQEKKIVNDLNFEPEAPPEGTYKTVDAQDLPVGETLTVIDGKGPTGWDTYKVIEKDPFSVTLKDGEIIELKPFDRVQINVDGIEHKLGSDGLFDGYDVQIDPTGSVRRVPTTDETSPERYPGEQVFYEDPIDYFFTDQEAPRRGYAAPSGYASSGEFADVPVVMQLPEIVELGAKIFGGQYPRVKRKMRANARGLFRPGTGAIEIDAALFADANQAAKTVAHEIGHLVDWLPDYDLKRGNILGHLAALKKYMKHQIEDAPGVGGPHITAADKRVLKDEARRLLEEGADVEIDSEITGELSVSPEDILSVFNAVEPSKAITPELLNYIKGLNTAAKKSIVKAAMKGFVPDEIGRIVSGSKKSMLRRSVSEAEVLAKFQELFVAELKKRRLIHRDMIMDELKGFTMKWKPFDEAADAGYTKYRHKPAELYADAFSAFVTNPGFLAQEAPVYFKSFMAYLENRPEVKEVWDGIQNMVKSGSVELTRHRAGNVGEMFQRGHAARASKANEKPRTRRFMDELITGLVDRHYAALKEVRKLEKQNTPAGKRARLLRYDLEELPYISSEADVYMKRFYDGILADFRDRGVSVDDLGFYMFLLRVMGDRSGIANPLGHTPETAAVDLANMKAEWGPEKTAFFEEMRGRFRDLREELIFPLMRESGLFSADLMKRVEETENYSKFSVVHYLEEQFGHGVSAKVFRQIGTLSDIENPVVPTVLQDLSVMRAARINIAKRDLVTTLRDAGLIARAEMTKSQVPVPPKDKWMDVLTVMEDGKPVHYYVSREIVNMFDHSPVEASGLARIMRAVSQPIREVLVSKNPVWMARNVIRDYLTTGKNLSEVGVSDMVALGKYYKQAFGEVVREVFKGERSADIEEMYSLKAIPKDRHWSGWDDTMDTELDRLADDFNVIPSAMRGSNYAVSLLKRFWDNLDRAGKVSEMVGKLAAFKYLKARSGKDFREISHDVRSRVGTPDIKRTGAWHQVTNNLFMFSNVGKEGLRAALESFKNDPGGYAFKTFMFNILPKMLMWGAGSGVFYQMFLDEDEPDDAGEYVSYLKGLQRTVNGIPEYDKSMYTVVPLWVNAEGKSVYLRFPQDYEGQFFGALAHKALVSKKYTGHSGVVNLMAEQNPYKPNPLITAVYNLFKYYVRGQNPVDDYRGQMVMPDRTFKAGGKYAAKAMAKSTWKTLGGSVIYDPPYDDLDVNESAFEKATRYFGLNILGAFLKVSDQGIKERIEAETREIERRKAVEGIVRTEGLIKIMNGEAVSVEEAMAIMAQPAGARKRQLQGFLARKCGNAYVSGILRAKGDEERAAAWRVMIDDNFTAVNGDTGKAD